MQKTIVREIEIKNITPHGRTGAVNGGILSENDKSYAFVICTNSRRERIKNKRNNLV
jgi:hypothetical protein